MCWLGGFNLSEERDPLVAPLHLVTATDDAVCGNEDKRSQRHGWKVTIRYTGAGVNVPLMTVGEAVNQGSWFLRGPGRKVILTSSI